MFDHNLYQENLVGVDFCERMVGETNPGVLARAEVTEAPHAVGARLPHHRRHHAGLQPDEGRPLPGGAQDEPPHPGDVLPDGGAPRPPVDCSTRAGSAPCPRVQLFNDYLYRLVQATPSTSSAWSPSTTTCSTSSTRPCPATRRWAGGGSCSARGARSRIPDTCDFRYDHMTSWGRDMFVTPGIVVDGELVTTDLVEINLGMRILLGSSFYDDWARGGDLRHPRPPRQPRRPAPPVEPDHPAPAPAARPRPGQLHVGDVAPVARPPHRRAPGPRHRRRPPGPAVGHRPRRPGRHALRRRAGRRRRSASACPAPPTWPRPSSSGGIPQWSNTLERDRARTYFQAYSAAMAFHFLEKAMAEVDAGRMEVWTPFEVPEEAVSCGFHEAVRGVLSHHMVIRNGRIANYHPYPPTCWNASPRDSLRHRRTLRGRGRGVAHLRGERPRRLQGHRHHAHRPQLRPLPAVWGAHVPRPGEGPPAPPLAHPRPPVSAAPHLDGRDTGAPYRCDRARAAAGRLGGDRRRGPRSHAPAGRGRLPRRDRHRGRRPGPVAVCPAAGAAGRLRRGHRGQRPRPAGGPRPAVGGPLPGPGRAAPGGGVLSRPGPGRATRSTSAPRSRPCSGSPSRSGSTTPSSGTRSSTPTTTTSVIDAFTRGVQTGGRSGPRSGSSPGTGRRCGSSARPASSATTPAGWPISRAWGSTSRRPSGPRQMIAEAERVQVETAHLRAELLAARNVELRRAQRAAAHRHRAGGGGRGPAA